MKGDLIFEASNKVIKVLEMDYGFTQNIDETGSITSYPAGGTINLVIETTEDTQILDWMINPRAKKSGRIEIQLKKKKVVKFKNAYCIQYHESFSHLGGEQPMSTSFTISAEKISIDNIGFETKRKSF
jgi:hypothetical protein